MSGPANEPPPTRPVPGRTTAAGEAVRKSIHLGVSLVAAGVVLLLPPMEAAVVLAAATFVALSVELARRVSRRFASLFQGRLAPLLRGGEAVRLTGATSLSVGYTVTAVILPGLPALAGILYTGIADAAAAVVGKRFGRLRYRGGKSLEGSLTFLVVVFGLSLALPGVAPLTALAVAVILTIIEAPTLRIDDNLYLPIAGATAFQVAVWLTGPTFFS